MQIAADALLGQKSFDIYNQPSSSGVATPTVRSIPVLDATDVTFAKLDTLLRPSTKDLRSIG